MHHLAHHNPECDIGHVTFAANVLQAGGIGDGGHGGCGAGVQAKFHTFHAHVKFVTGAVHAAGVLYEQHGGGGGGGGGGMLQWDEFQMHGLRQWPLSLMAGHGGGGGGAGPTW